MTRALKLLLICLTALAVSVGQIAGLQAGFFCHCTGEVVEHPVCLTGVCHDHDHAEDHGCAHEHHDGHGGHEADADCGDACGHSPHEDKPCSDHEHSELRTELVLSGFPSPPVLPPVLFFDLFQPYPLPALTQSGAHEEEAECVPRPPGGRCPPMPLLVAETMVMLI